MNKHSFDIEDEKTSAAKSIRRIADLLGRTPTQKQYKANRMGDELSFEQICYRFGPWSEAVKFAGLIPNPAQSPPKKPEIAEEQLIDEFFAVAQALGRIPSERQFGANSRFSGRPYRTRWGSWRKTIDYIVNNYATRFKFDTQPNLSKTKVDKKRNLLGIALPLKHQPSNEYETIVLFSLLAEQLGYNIIKVQSDFPDAIIEKNGKEIEVEFEYLSSNYIQHCHPMDFRGTCICWRKDIALDRISILSLEEYIRSLHS
jgi:hypothetical protein